MMNNPDPIRTDPIQMYNPEYRNINPLPKQAKLPIIPRMEKMIPDTDKKDELRSKLKRNPYFVNFTWST